MNSILYSPLPYKRTMMTSLLFINYSSPSSPSRREAGLTIEQQQILEDLLAKAGEETSPLGIGQDIVSGSLLPSHSDVHHSCLDGQRIQVTSSLTLESIG